MRDKNANNAGIRYEVTIADRIDYFKEKDLIEAAPERNSA